MFFGVKRVVVIGRFVKMSLLPRLAQNVTMTSSICKLRLHQIPCTVLKYLEKLVFSKKNPIFIDSSEKLFLKFYDCCENTR